jgi:hypothetical protein
MREAEPLTSERLRALTSDLITVVRRHTPNCTAPTDEDPGIILVSLFAWLADLLTEYQDRIADEAMLGTRRRLGVIVHHILSDASPVVTVDGVRWQPIAAWSEATPGDRRYVVETGADGTATLVFGDGGAGARPPVDGSEMAATYRSGSGAVRLTATFRWPPEARGVSVRLGGGRVAFEPARPRRRGVLARLLDCFHR